MSEESAPAPSQGIGAWIVSGSVALVMVIGGAVAVNSADKSAEEGNPTPNQTVAPGGGHTTGPTGDTAAPPATDPTQAQGAAGVLGLQLTNPGATGRGSGDTAGRAPWARPTAPPRLNGLALAADRSAPVGLNPDQAAQLNETPEAPDQIPATSEPNTETGVRGGAPVPSEPGIYSLTWHENGQQFSAQVTVGQDGRVTIIDADGIPDPYHYDPSTGRLIATVAPEAGTGQHTEASRDVETGASNQGPTDTASSEITIVESSFPATTAPLATIGSTQPSTHIGNPAEPTQPNFTEARATPTGATQILTEDTETEQPRVEATETEQPRAEVTETTQTQAEPAETKQPRTLAQTKQPLVQTTRTRPARSQSRAQPTETAPRSADANPGSGRATPTTSSSTAPAA